MTDNIENKSSSRNNNVLSQSTTQTDRETTCDKGNVNADLSTKVAAATVAAASLDSTDLEKQDMYLWVSQKVESKRGARDHTLGDTLFFSKQIQNGQVPEAVQHSAAAKEDNNNNWDNDVEKDVENVTKKDKQTDIDCNKHGKHTSFATVNNRKLSEAKHCAFVSSPTTTAAQHQQQHDTATMPTLKVSSRPPVLPSSADDSVRRHYVLPTQQATPSRLVATSAVNSLRQQSNSNVENNASSAQTEALPVAVPAEEVAVDGYAVRHDVSQDEVHKRVQMVRACRDSCRLYFVVFLVLAAAVMIASIVAITRNKSEGQEQDQKTETAMTVLQYNPQGKLIMSIMGADAGLLIDASSPYAKALNWMLQSNERNESLKMARTLAQRFYLASFYYDTTTDDDKWTYCNPPKSTSKHDQTCLNPLYNTTSKAWLSDSHECEWAGVFCDYHQQIIELVIEDMNLVGTIPSSVVKFPFLQLLWLTSSRLEGNILLLSNYHHLTTINFENNSLSGDLSSVWQHRKLKYFDFSINQFTGSLSFEIGNLVDLKHLTLRNIELTGTVPIEVGWLDSIDEFRISNNHFRGKLPPSMQLWNMIYHLELSKNSFTGSIPTFLGQLNKTLQGLNLFDNSFTGTLPNELFHLTELLLLDVSNNELSGTLDARFTQLTSLQQNTTLELLGLSDNHFTGSIPTELGLLTNLYIIYLHGNDFTGSVPAYLCHNKVHDLLSDFYISETNFTLVANCAKNDNGQVEVQCACCTTCCQAGGRYCGPL